MSKRTDYKPKIGQVSSEIATIPGISHRLVKIGPVWVHTRYERGVLTVREELTTEGMVSLLLAAEARGGTITVPVRDWGVQVYSIWEQGEA